jgi:hypothetical protein
VIAVPFNTPLCLILVFVTFAAAPEANAQGKLGLAKELVESLGIRFSKEVAEEGAEILTRKVETFLVKYGDDGADALRKVGPYAIQLVDDAAADGVQATRWLAKFGDEATSVVRNETRRNLATKLGDEAAEALIKHGEIAEPILELAGKPAANALRAVSEQNARRIGMMAKSGELEKIGRTSELMDTIGKYGDRGMDFVWKNKGALAVSGALVAFLANPEPFIDGTQELANVVAQSAIEPIAKEVGNKTNWTVTIITLALCAVGYLSFKTWIRQRTKHGAR